MISKLQIGKALLTFSLLILISNCGARLKDDPLNIALLDTEYYENLSFSDTGAALSSNDYIFSLYSGDLPEGFTLTAEGEISGTPTALGLYEFDVKLYSIDEGSSDDSVSTDIDTLSILVTEASTNSDCPLPTDDTTTETYVCAGSGFLATLAEGDSFDLDINYFVELANSFEYEIDRISFSITYDETLFTLDDNDLNSQILREAAEGVGATVTFNNDTAGVLKVTLQTTDEKESFRFSGRLMNIPFYAKSNVPADSYDFALAITKTTTNDGDITLPDNIAIDGTVTVEEDVVTE